MTQPALAYYRHADRPLSVDALHTFIKAVEQDFVPPLSQQQDLEAYAEKLLTHAEIDYAIDKACEDRPVVAAIACYANDRQTYRAYATFYSILPDYRGQGVARPLLEHGIESCRRAGMRALHARTWHRGRILAFYEAMGFRVERTETNEWGVESLQLVMSLGEQGTSAPNHGHTRAQ